MTDPAQAAPAEAAGPVLPAPVQRLTDLLADAVLGHVEDRGELTILLRADRVPEAIAALRDDPDLAFAMLSDVTAVDYSTMHQERGIEGEPRFGVVWQLFSLARGARLRLKASVPEDDPTVPSIVSLFPGANWPEREVYDMYGIVFAGHPNLTRILMPDEWQGHVLRKDYPIMEEAVEFTVNTPEPDRVGPAQFRDPVRTNGTETTRPRE